MDSRREFIVGCAIAVAVMLCSLVGFAEDPIVVHYSVRAWLRQQNSPATPENSAAFQREEYGVGADALSDVGSGAEEFGLIPCVLIPSGLNDQPLSSLHEEVRSTPAPMTMIPITRLRYAFIGADSLV